MLILFNIILNININVITIIDIIIGILIITVLILSQTLELDTGDSVKRLFVEEPAGKLVTWLTFALRRAVKRLTIILLRISGKLVTRLSSVLRRAVHRSTRCCYSAGPDETEQFALALADVATTAACTLGDTFGSDLVPLLLSAPGKAAFGSQPELAAALEACMHT